ncbi:hypothetical protein [Paenibacillus sp. 1001270B_150601_E10]|uniref:hypothetical protein n=1 Tax=Paenibacillus sp. 1001270B_150601_E10 TaxID=2787079 RepID=UPI0018A063FD|nr:hypothetical protein [Paenibacillus sp. 1001270B_150601_E10]
MKRWMQVDNRYGHLLIDLMQEAAKQKGTFDLAKLTPFEWDSLSIIPPYTDNKSMYEQVGMEWSTSDTYMGFVMEKSFGTFMLADDSLIDERLHRLVFVNDSRVVADLVLDREMANFQSVQEVIYPSTKLTVDEDRRITIKR